MCMCKKPTINGERGYRWNNANDPPSVYPVNPPALKDGDELIHDEPGRCGGLDSHSHHFRVVKRYGSYFLLVRHGGGDEAFEFSGTNRPGTQPALAVLAAMDSNGRYWMLQLLYHAFERAVQNAVQRECSRWTIAAIEKRIKVRHRGGRTRVEHLPVQMLDAV